MTTSTLSLAPLALDATQDGPLLRVSVSTPTTVDAGTLCLTIPEWSSLAAVADALAAGDRRHAEDRKEIERMRAINALDGEWIDHAADTEIRLRAEIDRLRFFETTSAADAIRMIEAARAEIDVLRQECRELTAQRDAACSALALRERTKGEQ